MSHPQRLKRNPPKYVRYETGEFTTVPLGLVEYMARVQCGRNAWAVMMCLSQQMYLGGKLGMRSREAIAAETGLTEAQVSRGMTDLKERLVIEPVVRWNSSGKEIRDKSSFGHVARYQLTREAWSYVKPNISSERSG